MKWLINLNAIHSKQYSKKDYSVQPQDEYLQDKADNPVRQGIYFFSLQKDKLPLQVLFETPGQ